MRTTIAFAVTSALALALTACGPSDADDADEVAATDEDADEVVADGSEAEGTDEGEATDTATGEEAGSDEAEPAPTPSASASPSAAPAPVAVAVPAKFATCTACHNNGIGPTLAGVVGRRAGGVSGFSYSPAMAGANLTWTEANLRRYLVDPNAVVSGTTMPPPGLTAAEAAEMVTYLKTL